MCRVIGVQSHACPITDVWFELFVTGYPYDSHVKYKTFNGFLYTVSFNFQNLGKVLQMFLLKRSSHKTFLIPKFVIDMIN